MSSCSPTNYFQICKIASDLPISSSGAYEFSNQDIDIKYDFWSSGGNICFAIKNKTNSIIYIDLSKSFLIKNGIAYDYFLNRTVSSSSTLTSSKGAGTSANAFGYFKSFYRNIPGSISAYEISSTASQQSSSISTKEKTIIAIPPYAAKVFMEYSIMNSRYQNCELYESPSKNKNVSMSFNLINSPVAFTNSICYHIGDNEIDTIIENQFFINEITNQHYNATIHKVEVGCPSDAYKTKDNAFIRTSPKEFYIEYHPRVQKKSKPALTNKRNGDSIYGD